MRPATCQESRLPDYVASDRRHREPPTTKDSHRAAPFGQCLAAMITAPSGSAGHAPRSCRQQHVKRLVALGAFVTALFCVGAASDDFVDSSHLVWTTIGQTSRSEVDLWTKTSSGCACNSQDHHLQSSLQQQSKTGAKNLKTCACCSHPGACQCGPRVPYRCAQCGLEQQCDQMCNVTLDAGQLYATSRLRYGQIKSLELRENQACWYRLTPEPGYRIEVQLYRLVDMGQLNQSRCTGGHLEWITSGSSASSDDSSPATTVAVSGGALRQQRHRWTLCGANERYSPPALLFSDDDFSPATLILRSGESTRRGKLLAHFSFTPVGHQAPLGVQIVGGIAVHGTDCDWQYQQSDCVMGARYNNTCRMASPGYPGLYPPNRTCRYRVSLQSPFQPLTMKFLSVQLPPKRCRSDNIRIFVNGRLRATQCGQETIHFTTYGPEILVEFNSGALMPPYVFNGFVAHLNFRLADGQPAQQRSRGSGQHRSPEKDSLVPDGAFRAVERQAHSVCDYVVRPNTSVAGSGTSGRSSGFFSTSQTAWRVWPAPCSFTFPVQAGQSVQINLLTYNITGPDCVSFIEIHEGAGDVRWSSSSPRQRICSPAVKKARNSLARFTQPLLIQSNNSSVSIRFRMDPVTGADQIIEGAFAYYNEYEGYRQQGTLCDAQFDGKMSPLSGRFDHSFDSTIFWSVTGSFNCTSIFIPENGTLVTLKVTSSQMKDDGLCHTIVDRSGYHCISNQTEKSNHVVLTIMDKPAVCLCGDIQIFLPVVITSNTQLGVRHHIADFTFGQPDIGVDFSYDFLPDRRECGHLTYLNTPSGTILPTHRSRGDRAENEGFHHTDCLWIATAKPQELWSASVFTPHKGDCADWNVTLYRFEESWPNNKLGQVIDVLCPNAEKHAFVMPAGTNAMAIRLQAWDSQVVDYRLTWQISALPSPDPGIQRSLSALITTSVPAVGQLDNTIKNVSSANLLQVHLLHCTFVAITTYLLA